MWQAFHGSSHKSGAKRRAPLNQTQAMLPSVVINNQQKTRLENQPGNLRIGV
jgi:hypothetical protein